MEYVDSPDWICETSGQEIRISIRVLEILWASVYAYMAVYLKHAQNRLFLQKQELVYSEYPETEGAIKLLKWAIEGYVNEDRPDWPDELPKPIKNPESGSLESLADELCLGAAAFALHHELAHIRLGHNTDSPFRIEQENEADSYAADWVLDGLDIDDKKDIRFIKRTLLIAMALQVLCSLEIHCGVSASHTHPSGYDRLMNTLSRYLEDDDDHVTWAVLSITMKMHLDAVGILTPNRIYDSFREALNEYADVLSERA